MRRIRELFRSQGVPRSSPVAQLVKIKPVLDIPFPEVDLSKAANPIPAIMAASAFEQTVAFFADEPIRERSLVSETSQALIHAVIRNQRPSHVVEIGTYRGGTTEAMCRAVLANGAGAVHTVGPFDQNLFPPGLEGWPAELKAVVTYYPLDSMAFFMEMKRRDIRPGVVFVDGDHDYEFALFDIQSAARRLLPGGFIFVDDVVQAGPYFAALDFLARQPDWIECGCAPRQPDQTKSFDRSRCTVPGTSLMVLRAPAHYRLGMRPHSFGEIRWEMPETRGLRLSLDGQQKSGTLHAQSILRGFGDMAMGQASAAASQTIDPGVTDLEILFERPLSLNAAYGHYRVEPWLIWIGGDPPRLTSIPVPI